MSENEVAFFFVFRKGREGAMPIDASCCSLTIALQALDSVCAAVFSFLKKHHLLAPSVDPHDPPDETDEARSFLSLSFLCASLSLLFQPVMFILPLL